jgi:hypothetical protein
LQDSRGIGEQSSPARTSLGFASLRGPPGLAGLARYRRAELACAHCYAALRALQIFN